MKSIYVSILILFATGFSACGQKETATVQLSARDFATQISQKDPKVLLDVRTQREFKSGQNR